MESSVSNMISETSTNYVIHLEVKLREKQSSPFATTIVNQLI